MTNSPSRKLSRRDALKLLGAGAGASILANLPTKWTKPELVAGVLPAHAQTSGLSLLCAALEFATDGALDAIGRVSVAPALQNILLNYVITTASNVDFGIATPASPVPTDATGQATVTFPVTFIGPSIPPTPTVTVTWSFANPLNGSGSCSQTGELPT